MTKLSNKTATIIAIVLAGTITVGGSAGAYFYTHRHINSDPLTSKLGVSDAVTKNKIAVAPYNLSLDSFKKAISEDSYESKNFNTQESLYETLFNKDDKQLYNLTRQYSLNGTYKDNAGQKSNHFGAYLTTYGDFENPSSLRLNYNFDSKTDTATIKQSAKEIIAKLFNSSIADFMSSQTADNYSTKVKSPSGKYTLTITQVIKKSDKGNNLVIKIDFDDTIPDSYSLDTFVHDKGITPIYQSLGVFKGAKTSELAEKFSVVNGTHTGSRLDTLENTIDNYSSYKIEESTIKATTTYENGTTTAAQIYIQNTLDNNNTITKHSIKYDAALQYKKTSAEVLDDAKKALSGIMGVDVTLTDDEIKAGTFTRTLKQKIGDIEYDAKIKVTTSKDTNGFYGNVQLAGN